MYNVNDISLFTRRSHEASDFYVGMRNAYNAVNASFDNVISNIFATFGAFVVWIFMIIFKQRLKKAFTTAVVLDDYKKVRLEYDSLNRLLDKMDSKKGNFATIEEMPWQVRGIVKQGIQIRDLIAHRRDAIAMALSGIDSGAPTTTIFVFRTERDLWSSRTKVHDYRF